MSRQGEGPNVDQTMNGGRLPVLEIRQMCNNGWRERELALNGSPLSSELDEFVDRK